MRSYNLNIAGYNIRFESPSDGPELVPSEKFLRYISGESNSDILVTVHSGKYGLPSGAKRVFDAPYVEEINGIRVKKSNNFWSVYKDKNFLFIKTVFPLSLKKKKGILRFSLKEMSWDLWLDGTGDETDPMEYPLDGLILYYLSVINGDIMIHASGVNNSQHGFLFSGVSGKGKTTMARLWDQAGARVIHDDRLILRKTGTGYLMYNTPVYKNDEPLKSQLSKIFLIEHGNNNELIRVRGAESVSRVMANCIQHNWDPCIIARLLGSVSIMCGTIPVVRILFRPDRSVIDHILENE